MKKLIFLSISAVVFCIKVFGQIESPLVLKTNSGGIHGSLLMPANVPSSLNVAIIIAGSGPTDRNGNNTQFQNNSLKMLAQALAAKGIASVRYDKRAIGESSEAAVMESDLRFETYIDDATDWIKLLKADTRFKKVIVIGHSEGSLIGMVAALKGNADGYISLEGAGRPIDVVIREQLKAQPSIAKQAGLMMDTLVKGDTLKYVPGMLYSLFRPSVQPYMISWMKYNPSKEIAKLHIPTLIIQGTNDIQVSMEDANALHAANKSSKLVTINGMNHIFKSADADRLKNIATYSNPELPIVPAFANAVADFAKNIR